MAPTKMPGRDPPPFLHGGLRKQCCGSALVSIFNAGPDPGIWIQGAKPTNAYHCDPDPVRLRLSSAQKVEYVL
jgi:hypothetical protein